MSYAFGVPLGFPEYGEELLSKFKWGHAFRKVNGYETSVTCFCRCSQCSSLLSRQLLAKYAKCEDSTEVVKVQNEWLEQIANEHKVARQVDDGML
jgi:pre-rRNA-processing protein TSR3